MPIVSTLDRVFLQPLIQLCDDLFSLINATTQNPGLSLVALGVLINAILLPMYLQMEKNGQKDRKIQSLVRSEVNRIKKHFTGRESYFYVQTVYRVHKYSPFRTILRSAELFVQVLVFSTMYRYLSECETIQGSSFGPIRDLSHPDGLMWGLNLLPLVMTLVNLLSVFAYDSSKRKQGIVLSVLFLTLLYSSPSGLVIYWTSSNLFSWLRNLTLRHALLKVPGQYRDRFLNWVDQA